MLRAARDRGSRRRTVAPQSVDGGLIGVRVVAEPRVMAAVVRLLPEQRADHLAGEALLPGMQAAGHVAAVIMAGACLRAAVATRRAPVHAGTSGPGRRALVRAFPYVAHPYVIPSNSSGAVRFGPDVQVPSQIGRTLSRTSRDAGMPRPNTIDGADSGSFIRKSCGSLADTRECARRRTSTRTNTQVTASGSSGSYRICAEGL